MKATIDFFEKCLKNAGNQIQTWAIERSGDKLCLENRPLNINICAPIFKQSDLIEFNAYSIYYKNEDDIFVTEKLCNFLLDFFKPLCKEDDRRINWMIYIVSHFCIAHEFTHLYDGHCQINDKNMLCMIPCADQYKSIEFQSMEYIADYIAGIYISNVIYNILNCNNFCDDLFDVKDDKNIIKESLLAIQGFFFVIRVLEKNIINFCTQDHPPAILRFLYISNFIILSLNKVYNINVLFSDFDKDFEYNNGVFSHLLGIKLTDYILFNDRKLISDAINYQKKLANCWSDIIKPKTRQFSRMKEIL